MNQDKHFRVRVESDGTPRGTRVIDPATGKELEGLMAVSFSMEGHNRPVLTLKLANFDFEADASSEVAEVHTTVVTIPHPPIRQQVEDPHELSGPGERHL